MFNCVVTDGRKFTHIRKHLIHKHLIHGGRAQKAFELDHPRQHSRAYTNVGHFQAATMHVWVVGVVAQLTCHCVVLATTVCLQILQEYSRKAVSSLRLAQLV